LALCAAINNEYPSVEHRLCSWHVARNLHVHFRYLQSADQEELKSKIVNLPFVENLGVFEENIQEIIEKKS